MQSKFKLLINLLLVLTITFSLYILLSPTSTYAQQGNQGNQGSQGNQGNQGNQPDPVCEHGEGWEKKDNLTGITYFYTAPEDKLIAETCYYSASKAFYADINPPVSSITIQSEKTNDNGEIQEISHATFRLIDKPTTPELLPLKINKTVNTSLTRTWDWKIKKEVDVDEVELKLGEKATLNYTVTLKSRYEDSDWKVFGNILVKNPNESSVIITNIKDIISPNIEAIVMCSQNLPYTIGGGERLRCTYYQYLSNSRNRTNTAKVYVDSEYNNHVSKSISFRDAKVNHVDRCVYLSDSLYDIGTEKYCASKRPSVITYNVEIEGEVCGVSFIENIATIEMKDSEKSVSDKAVVKVVVEDEKCYPNGDNGDDKKEEKDEEEVLGDGDKREVKGVTTVVHAPTAGEDNVLVYVIELLLLFATLGSLIYIHRVNLNKN
jgi:hypothetical protein